MIDHTNRREQKNAGTRAKKRPVSGKSVFLLLQQTNRKALEARKED